MTTKHPSNDQQPITTISTGNLAADDHTVTVSQHTIDVTPHMKCSSCGSFIDMNGQIHPTDNKCTQCHYVLLVKPSRQLIQYGVEVEDANIEEKPPCCTFTGANVCTLIVVLCLLTGLILLIIGGVQNEGVYIGVGIGILLLPVGIGFRYTLYKECFGG